MYLAYAISWCISELHSSYDWSTSSVGVFSICIFFLFRSIESDSGRYNVLQGWTCVRVWYRVSARLFFTSVLTLFHCFMVCGVWCISTVVWLFCDLWFQAKELLLWVLHFTTLLIEHSFSRHLYNSMEHLITLLSSCDMNVVLGVLNLLYMFSKRSNFITRLNNEKRQALLSRLTHLAEASYINCMAAYVIYHNCAHNHL